jgi:hypothetical protein
MVYCKGKGVAEERSVVDEVMRWWVQLRFRSRVVFTVGLGIVIGVLLLAGVCSRGAVVMVGYFSLGL